MFKENFSFLQSGVPTCHENTIQVHAGHKLQYLENNIENNNDIKEVIKLSREVSVLSKYTAFLCLEKGMEFTDTLSNETNGDGGEILITTDDLKSLEKQHVSPNPFHDIVTIELTTKIVYEKRDVEISIFDINGQLVDTILDFDIEEYKINTIWNSEKFTGQIYFCRIITKDKSRTIKLVKI